MVSYWADEGVSWFKAYTQVSRAELAAAIEEAHKKGVKVTAHLCSVTFREAAALGIDALEHGLTVNTDFHANKAPDTCPTTPRVEAYGNLDMDGPEVKETIRQLVAKNIAITSTLPVGEMGVPGHRPFDQRVIDAVHPEQREAYLARRAAMEQPNANAERMIVVFKKAMKFEYDFVKAGGLLGAGMDPSVGNLPGFGDQRNMTLFMEAGFTPAQAIQIMTSNGAKILGASDRGTITVGKAADLVVVRGDLTAKPEDLQNVVTVFKDGVGYDSLKLIDSVKGIVGIR
jgi:imidazolonepropionase-like amidohydrolase